MQKHASWVVFLMLSTVTLILIVSVDWSSFISPGKQPPEAARREGSGRPNIAPLVRAGESELATLRGSTAEEANKSKSAEIFSSAGSSTSGSSSRSSLLASRPVNAPWCSNAEGLNVQPELHRPIPSYTRCPLPGLNNVLYTQVNRWYCAYRDRAHLHLRDRSCGAGRNNTAEPFRFSSILHIHWALLEDGNTSTSSRAPEANNATVIPKIRASICWRDDLSSRHQLLPRQCAWKHIPGFYGRPEWWDARRLIDFHPFYYTVARALLEEISARFSSSSSSSTAVASSSSSAPDRNAAGRGSDVTPPPFIAVHLRRGDYAKHCKLVAKQEPWVSFAKTKGIFGGRASCYPTMDEIVSAIQSMQQKSGIHGVFIATNAKKDERAALQSRVPGVVFMSDTVIQSRIHGQFKHGGGVAVNPNVHPPIPHFGGADAWREVDLLILEMAMVSFGAQFIFNKHSSLSAMVYEMGRIHNRIDHRDTNVVTW